MGDAYLYDAVRTPRGRGKPSGALYTVRPVDLLATALRGLSDRTALDLHAIDDVSIGCVTQIGEQGACIARTGVLVAGWPETVPALTLNRFCGSGLEAVNGAAAKVASGYCDWVVAGGVESMSRVAMGSDGGAIWDPSMAFQFGTVPQGISADLLATVHGITRAEVDAWAVQSQARAGQAQAEARFDRSLVPVIDRNGRVLLRQDEHPRPGTTAEALSQLKPSFAAMGTQYGLDALTRRRYPQVAEVNHVHHAGNASGIVDGAAAVLVGSRAAGERLGLKPRARIRSFASVGDDPVIMLSATVPASQRALERAGMQIGDIDLVEINEAFAAVAIYTMRGLGLRPDQVNVDGGAIALGHPLGATGAMLLGTILDALERRDQTTGLVTLCIGGGMGIATIIERI